MADRVRVKYSYKDVEQWEKFQETVRKIINEDVKETDSWPETKSLPPFGFPPPVTQEALKKLQELEGVNIEVLEDD
ncbi:hypothetical protein G7046_g6118 [Stylonectria norvegica]|nr:hypothetical protein G7046_g6118 [Stylonectria norvegica]